MKIFGLIVLGVLLYLFIYDIFNRKHAIMSNFPLIGRLRYLLEKIGPELRQYIVAGNREEGPFNRLWREYIYASAKGQNNLTGFGSDADFSKTGQFFIKTAVFPKMNDGKSTIPSAKIIGSRRDKPYRPLSVINISAMSFGSLGKRATTANNIGANIAGAYHNTGEGGYSGEYHGNGADVVFHIGTGYFGCGDTDENGYRQFSMWKLKMLVNTNPNIKMIELKLSQGAKPGKGGILPANKVTKEIAKARGVEVGKTIYSPSCHSAFDNTQEMIHFIEEIAKETGLPVGIKSAVGKMIFWEELAQLINHTNQGPDFITIDGGEGGTGAAPIAFTDNMSLPLKEGFSQVYKMFQKYNVVDRITWIASGKLGHPTRAAVAFAMGADLINIAREVMLSAGCIQAKQCHTGNCPSGIATHNWWLEKGFNVKHKSERVGLFIKTLVKDILEVTNASGYTHPCEFTMDDVMYNTSDSSRMKSMEVLYGYKKNIVNYE